MPRSIMAAPLIRDGDCVGVIEILDRGSRHRAELADVDLLGLLAIQAALGLDMLAILQWSAELPASDGQNGLLAQIARGLATSGEPTTSAVLGLLDAARTLLRT